jgi:tetratricopeptide (TPR) repeat protein
MALKLNKNESAIQILENRPLAEEYEKFYFLDHLLGVAKLNKHDSTAIEHLTNFNANFKGVNYIKSNLQRMSWYYYIKGDLDKAKEYKEAIFSRGSSIHEEDKQAQNFAAKPEPNRRLLSTRLYYDGGYFDLALTAISAIDPKSLSTPSLKAEYCYRKGRILEKQGQIEPSLKLYEACTLFAIDSEEYYGAYAALYLGNHYLKVMDLEKAKKFYERALTFPKNKEYTESIELRAKAGLKKCAK